MQVISLKGVKRAGLTVEQVVVFQRAEETIDSDRRYKIGTSDNVDGSGSNSPNTYCSTIDEFIDASRTCLIAELNAFVDYYSHKLGMEQWERQIMCGRQFYLEELRQRYECRVHTCECPRDTLHFDIKNFLNMLKSNYDLYQMEKMLESPRSMGSPRKRTRKLDRQSVELEKQLRIELLEQQEACIRQQVFEVEEKLVIEKVNRVHRMRIEAAERTGKDRAMRLEGAKFLRQKELEEDMKLKYELDDLERGISAGSNQRDVDMRVEDGRYCCPS
jgi:hypothetical protein